jgi:hypothetical protein
MNTIHVNVQQDLAWFGWFCAVAAEKPLDERLEHRLNLAKKASVGVIRRRCS